MTLTTYEQGLKEGKIEVLLTQIEVAIRLLSHGARERLEALSLDQLDEFGENLVGLLFPETKAERKLSGPSKDTPSCLAPGRS